MVSISCPERQRVTIVCIDIIIKKNLFRGFVFSWCRGVELNYRHKAFQASALPLSYPGVVTIQCIMNNEKLQEDICIIRDIILIISHYTLYISSALSLSVKIRALQVYLDRGG